MFWNRIKSFLPYLRFYNREISIGLLALLLTDIAGLVIPWIIKNVIDSLPQSSSSSELLVYAGGLFVAASFQGLFRFGWRKYLFGPSRKIERDILNNLFDHFLRLDLIFFQDWKIGDLMSRATNDLRSVRDFLGLGVLILFDCLVVIFSCILLMSYINPFLMACCLTPLPIVSLLFYGFSKAISIQHRVVQESLAEISALVQENLAGIKVLHAYVQEEYQKKKFKKLNQNYLDENIKLTRLFGLFTPSLVFIIGVSSMISLWVGGKAVIAGTMTLGSFVGFNGYLMMLSWPMMGIGYVFNLSQKGLSAMARLEEVLDSPQVIKNSYLKLVPGKEDFDCLEIRDVCFSYQPGNTFDLSSIQLNLESGKTFALIGPVGSGKSTLVRLLPRLLDPRTGNLQIDGKLLRDFPISQLRSWIGYVDQEPYLFSASVRDNIAFGKTGVKEEDVLRVVSQVCLENDISSFPEGLDTFVGERGVSLSGGQKQRIALARALIRRPRILILDDAFSSLDVETEERVLVKIKEEIRSMVTLIVTHRLSTIRNVDEVIVMKNGRIIERGNHNDLLLNSGYYEKVFKSQLLAREMEVLMR